MTTDPTRPQTPTQNRPQLALGLALANAFARLRAESVRVGRPILPTAQPAVRPIGRRHAQRTAECW